MVRKFSHLVPWALILAAGVVACSASQREAAPSASRAEPASALGEELAFGRRATGLDKTAGEAEASAQDGLATLAANQPDRYLIKNAWLQLEVDDAPKAIETLSAAARNLGGYLSDMHERKLAVERSEITATLRVPAEKFEQAMTDAQALLMMNKPAGYECSRKPRHHPSVMSLLPAPPGAPTPTAPTILDRPEGRPRIRE